MKRMIVRLKDGGKEFGNWGAAWGEMVWVSHPGRWLCGLDECVNAARRRAGLGRGKLVQTYGTRRRRWVHPEPTFQHVADGTETG